MTDTHTTSHIPDEAVQAALDKWNSIPPSVDDAGKRRSMRRALAAALPHLAPCAVEVKKLEWFAANGFVHDEMISRDCFGNEFVRIDLNGISQAAIEKKKAAAQADFERRVRGCHAANPVDVAPIDANYILHPLYQLPSDGRGKCGWTDISNAIDEAHRRIRAISKTKTSQPIDVAAVPHADLNLICYDHEEDCLSAEPAQGNFSLGWVVRERRGSDGELLDCFVEAPRCKEMPYALEVLGDDYTGYGDQEAKLEHCKMIVAWANAAPTTEAGK